MATPVPTPAPPPTINLTLPGVLLYPELTSSFALAQLLLSSANQSNFSGSQYSCVTRRFNESCVSSESQNLYNIVWLGVPALLFLALGLVVVSFRTSEDGFVTGPRMIDAPEPWPWRYKTTALTYIVEGTQLAGLAFGPAAVRFIASAPVVQSILAAFFFDGGHWETTFIAVTSIFATLMFFMLWPMLNYWTLDAVEFADFEDDFVRGNFGRHAGFLQEVFMLYFTVPAFVGMLIMVPCTYYETGERATAVFGTTECNSSTHLTYALVGGLVALFCFLTGAVAGTVPIMTQRADKEFGLNGRWLSLNFMIKAVMAVCWVLFRDEYAFTHLICIGVGQIWLLYLNVSLRPCLIETVNFHRSAVLCFSLVPTTALIIGTGLADTLNALPTASGGVMAGLMFAMLLMKYYVFPCGKLFPAIPYQPPPPPLPKRFQDAIAAAKRESSKKPADADADAAQQQQGQQSQEGGDSGGAGCCGLLLCGEEESAEIQMLRRGKQEEMGEYEGGLILGVAWPQGQGMLRWKNQGKVWGGTFLFGRYHGYGVMTQYKYFFQGMHLWGARSGFGVTNQLEGADEDFYEGNWVDGEMSGAGTKQFTNNDTYDGTYLDGVEEGHGVWSFDTALGRHSIKAEFEGGKLSGFKLEVNENYVGEERFGVPHGIGRMEVDGNVFDGEWRAGKLHGNGTVTLADDRGTYEGILVEGKFHEDGTWRDATETYTGKWVHGQKHGTGKQEIEAGVYEGMFVRDVRMGFGTFTYKDGTQYNGSWYNNIYHGAGTLTSSDGAEYEGFWMHGKRHGARGKIRYPNGEQYVGDWDEDEYHGEGVLKIPGMGEYHGRFEFSRREGNGRFTFFDGSEYVGSWADDLAHGEGKFVFSSRKAIKVLQVMSLEDASKLEVTGPKNILDFGGVYEGDFADGTMNGNGAVKTGDGTLYEGDWRDGFPQGHGKMAKPSGHYYEGAFERGNPHGKGRMTYPDDRLYIGDFFEGKRHGQGVLYDAEGGTVYDCEWVNDVPEGMQGDAGKDAGEDQLRELPPVDIDDLLRVIMPSSQTPVDIEQTRFRRVMETDERNERFANYMMLDEARLWRHMMRLFMAPVETEARRQLEGAMMAEMRDVALKNLAHVLNQWKIDFRARTGSDPKRSDINKDPVASGLYKLYTDLEAAKKSRK